MLTFSCRVIPDIVLFDWPPSGLKSHNFLLTGFKDKDSQARLGQLSWTDPCSVPVTKDLTLNKPRKVLPKAPLAEAS